MVLPTPTTSATVEEKKATANEAEKRTAKAKATADSASDATRLSGLAVSEAYSAMHIAGGKLIVAAASGDKELITQAIAAHEQSISNLNLATKKNGTDKKTESVAQRDFLMNLGDSFAKLGDANASEFAWENTGKIMDFVGASHTNTQSFVSWQHADTQGVVKNSHGDTQAVVKKENADTKKTVALEADNGRKHSSQATYEHSESTRSVLGNKINALGESVKGLAGAPQGLKN